MGRGLYRSLPVALIRPRMRLPRRRGRLEGVALGFRRDVGSVFGCLGAPAAARIQETLRNPRRTTTGPESLPAVPTSDGLRP